MTARCVTCAHKKRAEIDAAIVSGEPHRVIAARYGISKAGVGRHARHAVTVATAKQEAAETIERTVLDRIREIGRLARAQFEAALLLCEEPMTATDAMREMGRMLELEAKLTGALAPKKVEHTMRDMSAAEQLAEVIKLEKEIAIERARLEAEERTIQ